MISRNTPGWPVRALALFLLGVIFMVIVMVSRSSNWLLVVGSAWVIIAAGLALRDLERMRR